MRPTPVSLAVLLTLGSASHAAAAQDGRDDAIAALKAQVAELGRQIAELEMRADAQSDINVATQQTLDKAAQTEPVAVTKGGLKLTSADKQFEVALGGRIHFDAYAFDRDVAAVTGTSEFRRARLTLQGKASGWDYKLEQDFAAGSNLDGLREAWIGRSAWGGKVTIGHFKPYRAMEELTSSNELLMAERPFASATGLFSGRQFQQGVGYLRAGDRHTAGMSVFNLRGAAGARNEGMGYAGRVTFAPVNSADATVHLGAWLSHENANRGSANLSAVANYAGRRGPSQTVATVDGASGESIRAVGLEAAASVGRVFMQGEYVDARFGQPVGPDHAVASWYVQGSVLLNGGHKAYKAGNGVFASPAATDRGLWELTARYDSIENKDVADMQLDSVVMGVNWYVNPNMRLMFNYTRGDNAFNGDQTGQYMVRTQFSW